MPRKKSPDAKDITMSARFSEAEAAEIDALRGSLPRSEWLRRCVLAAGRKVRDAASSMETQARNAAKPTAKGRLPPPEGPRQ